MNNISILLSDDMLEKINDRMNEKDATRSNVIRELLKNGMNLENKTSTLEKRIEDLKSENVELKEELEKRPTEKELKELKEENQELKNKLENLPAPDKVDEMEKEIERLERDKKELNQRLKEANKRKKDTSQIVEYVKMEERAKRYQSILTQKKIKAKEKKTVFHRAWYKLTGYPDNLLEEEKEKE